MPIRDNLFRIRNPLVLETPDLLLELQNGHDERFAPLRSDKIMKPFLLTNVRMKSISFREAVVFGEKVIYLTNKYASQLNANIHVSSNCDCAILDYQKRFKWLVQNKTFEEPASSNQVKRPTRRVKTRSRTHYDKDRFESQAVVAIWQCSRIVNPEGEALVHSPLRRIGMNFRWF
jgi:hypothetical protein